MKPFYDSPEYRKRQSRSTRAAWQRGAYDHLKTIAATRQCKREECRAVFKAMPFDPKVFCSHTCSALYNNVRRTPPTIEVRKKISLALKGRRVGNAASPISRPLFVRVCLHCRKEFATPRWKNHKYCSVRCAIRDIGSKPTSPKAARGKSGIRLDIDPALYFFSRWEANMARVFRLLEIQWVFQPQTFQLVTQRYTPDFYLPELDLFIEVKNFLSDYSKNRDEQFRKLYPNKKLVLILKADYLRIQEEFSSQIPEWEYS